MAITFTCPASGRFGVDGQHGETPNDFTADAIYPTIPQASDPHGLTISAANTRRYVFAGSPTLITV